MAEKTPSADGYEAYTIEELREIRIKLVQAKPYIQEHFRGEIESFAGTDDLPSPIEKMLDEMVEDMILRFERDIAEEMSCAR